MTPLQPVGIDLGTTLSAVGYLDAQGRTMLLRNSAGESLTPSVVLFDNDEIVVGREAVKSARTAPEQVAFAVKRDTGQASYHRLIRGQRLPPEMISAAILRKLREETVAALGESLAAVVTVPAYFDEVRRRETRRAAELAGWRVLDIVNEPTAAALAWCESVRYFERPGDFPGPQRLFVYDLGGGTFDATLIELSEGNLRTLATDGDFLLGGLDWDERLVNHAAEEFAAVHGSDPRQDEAARRRLNASAEQAKHALSQRNSTTIHVEHAGQALAVEVTRQLFEELTEDLLERTAFTSRQTLATAGCTWNDVSQVLLVGGSSRMPMVARCLNELSGKEPSLSATCDEDVARGAALFARIRLREQGEQETGAMADAPPQAAASAPPPSAWTPPSLPPSKSAANDSGLGAPAARPQPPKSTPSIVDVNAHSLGIASVNRETLQRENVILIPRNTPLPASKTDQFSTRTFDQRTVVIQVLEGENRAPDLCSQVARAVMRDLPARLPEGTPIEVTYRYERNGLLNIEAHLPQSGQRLTIEIERDAGLSSAGFSRWRELFALPEADDGWRQWEAAFAQSPEMIPPAVSKESPSEVEPLTKVEPPAEEEAGFAGVATGEPDGSVGDAYREQQEERKQASRRRLAINLTGHVVSSIIGLLLGYLILCWLSPGADFLHLFHD